MKGTDLYEIVCRTHGICGNNKYYISRTPDKIIDVDKNTCELDIPDWNTCNDEWITGEYKDW